MAEEAPMTELEEQVDLDSDNYNEEMDDDVDVDEPLEDDRVDEADDDNADEVEEEDHLLQPKGTGKKSSPENDGYNHEADESVEDGKPKLVINEEDRKKYAELLALPPHGSEVFVGGIPKDVKEEDLRDLCELVGEVNEIKMIKDKETGDSKGYAFITFKTRDFAQKAIGEFQNKEFKGRKLRCSLSQTKHRLFMGNIPKGWTEKEFKAVIEENGPGVETIDLVKDPQNPSRNRGFAFIEYYNNACADYARQKMSDPQFKLESSTPTVSWADSKTTTADPSAAAQVKALYVKNLPSSATNEKLKELFERHGEVTKVVLPSAKAGQSKRDFGFIHYAERSSALKAVKETETYEIDGQVLDVALAKPLNEKKFEQVPQRAAPAYNPPQPAYGFVGDPYRTLSSVYGVPGGYQPPMIYGRGPMPAGMQMVPMVLPDGQIGYVLQQPEARAPSPPPRRHERRNDNRSGSRGHGSPSRNEGSRGRRYRPY